MPDKYREVALIVGAATPNVDTSAGGMLQILFILPDARAGDPGVHLA